jgi:GNAT superfamily N-acetyltransferase
MFSYTIRKATLDDVADLKHLIALSARSLNAAHYNDAEIDRALAWVYGVDTRIIQDETYYVVLSGDQLVGCGGWSRRKKNFGGDQTDIDSQDFLNPATEAAKIRAFFVHPDFARQGIGKTLLEVSEAAAKAEGFKHLEMTATLTGRELYATCGYTAQEPLSLDVPNYGPFPALKMVKSF